MSPARCLAFLVLGLAWSLHAMAEPRARLWQTNSAGDDIHVIDVRALRVVDRIPVGPHPHGIAAPDDFRVVYVSLERNGDPHGELLWIDPRTHRVEHRMQVGREPHQLATTPGGRWIYVPCRDGDYWVVDARERKLLKKLHTGGRPHNTTASRDGRFVFLSPMGAPRAVTIVDVAAGHEVVGTIPFADSVRPAALSADGTRLYQHVDGLNGFQVADVGDRRVVATVEHATPLGWLLVRPVRLGWIGPGGLKRCHGLAIRPDGSELWSTCGDVLTVHALAPGFPEAAAIRLPARGYWLTFPPDGRHAFVALSQAGEVAVIDAHERRLVKRLPVGRLPKRNLVLELPE